jgi:Zn-dependent M28 family amino/carboxypeptidase
MKNLILVLVFAFVASCSQTKTSKKTIISNNNETVIKTPNVNNGTKPNTISLADIKLLDDKVINYYASTITSKDLKEHLTTLASDEFEGRMTGAKGQKMAAEYIKNHYKNLGIEPGIEKTATYFQKIPESFLRGRAKGDTENVLGFIYGTEKPEEIVVISAHYDHLGIDGEVVYNGADDNGSGTSAVLEIAEAFQLAVKEGEGPKRSILFLNLTGEEEGLFGSKFYVANPIFPLKNTVVDLNIDMVGRVDKRHADNPNFVYLIGADKISTELHYISEAINKKYTNLDLDYKYNDENDPNRFYYRSDHYNFAKNGIPIIFYFNGVHADYHKASDTVDKINFDILAKRAQLVFLTAWEIANRKERIKVD